MGPTRSTRTGVPAAPAPSEPVPAPRTALAFPFPDLQPILDRIAARYPDAVRATVPPHISVAYPFLPASALDDGVEARVARIAAAHPAQSVELGPPRCAPGIVYSAPSPRRPVDDLVADVEAAWPEVADGHARRAAGQEPIGPHLTLALGADGPDGGAHDEIRALIADRFPCRITLDRLWLSVREPTGWAFRASFALRPRHPG